MSDQAAPQVSLRDIAAMLGVSHSTVSLALRDNPRISQATKDRVREAAGKAGYQPDPMLAALANYRRNRSTKPINACIAWINAWSQPEELRKLREFDCYWKGAHTAANKFGFRIEEFRIGRDCSPRRLHQILSTRGINGILLPPHRAIPDWGDFPWEHYSVVRFGRSIIHPEFHVVTADQVANTILAVRRMHERGYRRIGFVGLENDFSKRGLLFRLGFNGGQHLIQTPDPLPPVFLKEAGPAERRKQLSNWIRKSKPDAILTSFPDTRSLLLDCGFKVPDDIALAVTSILDAKADAGIDQHPEEIGRVGFLMLNSLINDRARGIPTIFRQILVEGSWTDGSSLPSRV